ncbi:conserved hypothetical protein [Herminiimonas arsenicoxydans]|uniref:Oxidoreductase probably involved in sulfite reduction n=1 Tax=Herminiimonas arsenicoxydans TaxID=204773 RepID=A4G7N7_HERAR|nr:conserved hypothetical protein [Herminiimonas arsenicoxydans]
MLNIIKDKAVVGEDDWTLLRLKTEIVAGTEEQVTEKPEDAFVPAGKVIVPLAVWQAQRVQLEARNDIGVWLASDERPEALKDDAARFSMIAIDFPKFADGRGYSIAYNLRMRYGYTGELRAVGDVLRDQLFYMQRVGFNSFAIRADRDANDALKGLSDFSESYQQSWDKKTPLFRRVDRQAVAPK